MKLISRLKGGLGNQLFCYAAARRLAIQNGAKLVLDTESGFIRDSEYQRKYCLERFSIPCRSAVPSERFYPFERIRRGLSKIEARLHQFQQRKYIEQEFPNYDQRIVDLKLIHRTTVLDGLWQSEKYFGDISDTLRDDLKIQPPTDQKNINAQNWIKENRAVAIHIRWFSTQNNESNVSLEYYKMALKSLAKEVTDSYFAIFSDNPSAASKLLQLPTEKTLLVDWNDNHNGGEVYDLWLMTQCRHFIIANSTFSWWGAWLGTDNNDGLVFFPRRGLNQEKWTWDYEGQMPASWNAIVVCK